MNLTDGANFIRQNRNYIELDMYKSVKQLVKFNQLLTYPDFQFSIKKLIPILTMCLPQTG